MIADISLHHEELRDLCRRFHVRRLDVFGSAARGDFDPARSDLDFLVEFEPLQRGADLDAFFGLKEALEQLFWDSPSISSRPARSAIPISAIASGAPRPCSMQHEAGSISKSHIVQSAELLDRFTAGQSNAYCREDPMLRAAVERQFEIMGEA